MNEEKKITSNIVRKGDHFVETRNTIYVDSSNHCMMAWHKLYGLVGVDNMLYSVLGYDENKEDCRVMLRRFAF